MTLPPALYWSADLAVRHEDGVNGLMAGVIDATGSIFYANDGDRMRPMSELPADAVRLVAEALGVTAPDTPAPAPPTRGAALAGAVDLAKRDEPGPHDTPELLAQRLDAERARREAGEALGAAVRPSAPGPCRESSQTRSSLHGDAGGAQQGTESDRSDTKGSQIAQDAREAPVGQCEAPNASEAVSDRVQTEDDPAARLRSAADEVLLVDPRTGPLLAAWLLHEADRADAYGPWTPPPALAFADAILRGGR